MNKLHFSKPPLTLSDQIALLRSRQMLICDQQYAEEMLLRLNYYRFSGYALHFEIFQSRKRTHQFQPGTTFEKVVDLYEFDTRLRALLFRHIEAVEVAFRAAVCYETSISTGDPHWYLDQSRFDNKSGHARMIKECEREFGRSDEIFIKSYKAKYSSPHLPPAWMMSEILSIGRWSMIYRNLSDGAVQKDIARHFATRPHYLKSWLHCLSVLRNLCAHHCRIWNRNFTIRPALPDALKRHVAGNAKLSAQMIILAHLLKPLGKNIAFQNDWNELLKDFPDVPRQKMGLKP